MVLEPRPVALTFYGEPSNHPQLPWSWVEDELRSAGTYWAVVRSAGHPHPRPVWGVWQEHQLALSIGSPAVHAAIAEDSRMTVHLGSGTDVVIVEGRATVMTEPVSTVIAAYDTKYEWNYSHAEYGPMTRIRPSRVIAWRSAGWAGREGFQTSGSWQFD